MPFITGAYLCFALVFAVASRLLSGRAWAVARDLISIGFVCWWDWKAAWAAAGVGLLLWVLGRKPGRGLFWLVLLALTALFLGVRVLQRSMDVGALLAPAGFGFFMMRVIHYWIERSRQNLPDHGPQDVVGWLLYFPTVLIGPVQRFDDWQRWERRRRWDDADAAAGLRRMLYGYFRVIVLSFWLVGTVIPPYLDAVPAPIFWTVHGALTLYLTFSGLSGVAIGLGLLGGQRIPENFDAPFLSTSLPRFWRSWHMTVSEWCRTYVYLPILAGTRRPILASTAAMGAFALWHEVSAGYLAWGAWQALGLALWGRLAPDEPPPRWRPVGWLVTMSWVMVGFWMLRAWPLGGIWPWS